MDIFWPLQSLADVLTYSVFRIVPHSYWGDAVNFFIYDAIKIGLLLTVINYLMAVIRYYFPMGKVRDILAEKRWSGLEYLFAALLGMITPFCSCSSIPLFIGFLGAGIPLGVTFTFLICSPLVNEASLYLFPAMFGLKATLLYNMIGIAVSIGGGMLIHRLRLDKYVKPDLLKFKTRSMEDAGSGGIVMPLRRKAAFFWTEGWCITRQIFPYVLLGVGIGALIHGFVPVEMVEKNFSLERWWSIPLVTLLGVPLYANSVSVIPIMEAMVGKGIPLGTALTFMTSIVTISIPEALMLKKVMKWQLLALFFGITICGIILMGYILNAVF